MTIRNLTLGVGAILLTMISLALPAAGPSSVSHFKNVNAPGASQTDPFAINDSSVIAGDFVDSGGVQHGMILKGKTLTGVDNPDCTTTPGTGAIALYGINSKETVVGWCTSTKTGFDIAFSYFKGKFVNIAYPESISTLAQGINDKGQIVGTYFDSNDVEHGFLLSKRKYTNLDVPGGYTNSDAWAINDSGLITIFALNSGGTRDSFLFNGTTYLPIDVPGEAESFVAGIDKFGDRVYTVVDSSNNLHGAFFLNVNGGSYTVFDDPKGVGATQAFGLNDKLRIVGYYEPNVGPSDAVSQGYSVLGCCRGFPPK